MALAPVYNKESHRRKTDRSFLRRERARQKSLSDSSSCDDSCEDVSFACAWQSYGVFSFDRRA
jgi:hypothetical protein